MREAFVAQMYRSTEDYIRRHGTGGLALVKYQDGAFDLVVVGDGVGGEVVLEPLAGPRIEDEVEFIVDIESSTIGLLEDRI